MVKRRKLSEGSQVMTNDEDTVENCFDFAKFESWTSEDVSKYLTAKGFKNESQLFQSKFSHVLESGL